jgi:radical SAM protein with 4Fe4S-binding SPASM domain
MVDQGYAVKRTYQGHPLWQGSGPVLSSLDIELTERCNNACIHCYINLPAGDRGAIARELSTAEWRDVLGQAAGLGALSVRFTGGEPLLREDFAELYLHARQLGMRVRLFTNARLISPQLAAMFARIPPREKIEITVYGMTPETYDAIACAPGAYEQFRRGVDLLLEHQVPFIVKAALLPGFKAELQAFEAWARTLPWMEEPPSYSMFFDLRGRRDSQPRNKLIEKLRITPDEGLAILNRRAGRYRQEMTQFCSRFMRPGGEKLFTCGAGLGVSVDAYGRLQPCMLLRDPQLSYDLRHGTLRDALENFFPQMRTMQAENPLYLERCARCFLRGLCDQCPAKSWSEHGTLDTPVEYLCQIAHARARDLGLLSPGEHAWEVEDWQARVQEMEA